MCVFKCSECIYVMVFFNYLLTFYFKMFISTKDGIGALSHINLNYNPILILIVFTKHIGIGFLCISNKAIYIHIITYPIGCKDRAITVASLFPPLPPLWPCTSRNDNGKTWVCYLMQHHDENNGRYNTASDLLVNLTLWRKDYTWITKYQYHILMRQMKKATKITRIRILKWTDNVGCLNTIN